jgi:hypothetical protein
MTLQQAKSIARHLRLTLRSVRSGHYRVNFRDGDEAMAYYTDNLENAVNTAVEMARKRALRLDRLAAKNKCLAQSNKSRKGTKATKEARSSQRPTLPSPDDDRAPVPGMPDEPEQEP